jgi:hypothetical protein
MISVYPIQISHEIPMFPGAKFCDLAFYFCHWLTDLAGAEPYPQVELGRGGGGWGVLKMVLRRKQKTAFFPQTACPH